MANERNAGRKPIAPHLKKKAITICLKPWMIERLGKSKTKTIENALLAMWGDEPAQSWLQVRVTTSDKAGWVKKAQAENLKLSEWVIKKLNSHI